MIMVDEEVGKNLIEKFGYTNMAGTVEFVESKMENAYVSLLDSRREHISQIYIEDIPKMIKALQDAYNFAMEDK